MIKEKLSGFKGLAESAIWVIIFTAVIFINVSPQLIRMERMQFVALFSSLLLIFVFNRIIPAHANLWKRNIIKVVVYILYILVVYYALKFQKYSVWIFYFFPLLLAFSLSLTFITQPRALTLVLVGISVFLLGDIYWESRMSYDTVRVVFPLTFSKVFSLSLLSVFGYYLYRSQLVATQQANTFSRNLKKLNEEMSLKKEELEKANKRLEELSEAKSIFVATVSHELRTPLTAIQNSLKLIGYETGENATVNEYLDLIKKNIERQGMMIDNLLDTARIERGYTQGARTRFELVRLLEEVTELFKNQAQSKNVNIILHPIDADSFIWGDQEQLRRVFINLTDNAIKFTPSGGKVDIYLSRDEGNIKVTVSDSGCGIPKEEQNRIFEAFVQAKSQEPGTSKKGIGLGLTIVREIIDIHRGKVWVESRVGEGSKFFVLVPVDLRGQRR